MAWKYIIVKVGNQEVPFIFPENLIHSLVAAMAKVYFGTVAQSMAGGLLSTEAIQKIVADIEVTSAGEITMNFGEATGGSETLGIKARSDDTVFFQGYNYHHGYIDPET